MSLFNVLQYVTLPRLEIAYAVNKICQYMQQPKVSHWKSVKHLHCPCVYSDDNLSVVHLCANPMLHSRTKHMEIDLHIVHDQVASRGMP